MSVRQGTLDRIRSGEKTTVKQYLDDEDFAKEVLVTGNGKSQIVISNSIAELQVGHRRRPKIIPVGFIQH